MAVIRFLVGGILLALGRQLFWFFVAAAGFVVGLNLATRFLAGRPDWLVILIALAAGLVGALLAVFVQQLAVGVAGFVIGGFIAVSLLDAFNLSAGRLTWLVYLVAAVIGAILVLALFDWALIVLSSLAGAMLMVNALSLPPALQVLTFLGLVVAGIAIQAALMQRHPPPDQVRP